MLQVSISRGDANDRHFQVFSVESRPEWSVLDVLLEVVSNHDSTVAVRYACRVGMCGTCGVVVNGREALACQTMVSEVGRRIRLEPIRNHDTVRDLVSDLTSFFDRYRRVRPASQGVVESDQYEAVSDEGDCITCGLCVSACTMVALNPGYVGPAALYRAARLLADSREPANPEQDRLLKSPNGIFGCRGHLDCLDACPKGLPIPQMIHAMKRKAVVEEAVGPRSTRRQGSA